MGLGEDKKLVIYSPIFTVVCGNHIFILFGHLGFLSCPVNTLMTAEDYSL